MSRSTHFTQTYDDLKNQIINEIYNLVRHEDDQILELLETHRCKALITGGDEYDPQIIHDLYINEEDRLMASAGVYEDDTEYDINEFEVPFLIEILNSVEKHITED